MCPKFQFLDLILLDFRQWISGGGSQAVEVSGYSVNNGQFVEINDQVFRKKFCKLDHLGSVCRSLQNGFLQTGDNSSCLGLHQFRPERLIYCRLNVVVNLTHFCVAEFSHELGLEAR